LPESQAGIRAPRRALAKIVDSYLRISGGSCPQWWDPAAAGTQDMPG